MKKFYSLFLAAALAVRRPLKTLCITVGCLLSYFVVAALAVGIILFVGCGIYSVWTLFINLLFGKP